jgi:hypothetical protein
MLFLEPFKRLRGPRTLKNIVGCGNVLVYCLLEPMEAGKGNTLFNLRLLIKAKGPVYHLVLDGLHILLILGPTSRRALDHGLLGLCLNLISIFS